MADRGIGRSALFLDQTDHQQANDRPGEGGDDGCDEAAADGADAEHAEEPAADDGGLGSGVEAGTRDVEVGEAVSEADEVGPGRR